MCSGKDCRYVHKAALAAAAFRETIHSLPEFIRLTDRIEKDHVSL
jgi:hypothetical protein